MKCLRFLKEAEKGEETKGPKNESLIWFIHNLNEFTYYKWPELFEANEFTSGALF